MNNVDFFCWDRSESLIEISQSNFHTPDGLIKCLQSNFHTSWNFDCQLSVEVSHSPWNFDLNLQSNFHYPYENLQRQCQSNCHTSLWKFAVKNSIQSKNSSCIQLVLLMEEVFAKFNPRFISKLRSAVGTKLVNSFTLKDTAGINHLVYCAFSSRIFCWSHIKIYQKSGAPQTPSFQRENTWGRQKFWRQSHMLIPWMRKSLDLFVYFKGCLNHCLDTFFINVIHDDWN